MFTEHLLCVKQDSKCFHMDFLIISTTIICVKYNLCLIVEKTDAQTNSVAHGYTAK